MKLYKRAISLLVAFTMIIGMVPLSVFATGSSGIVQIENISEFAGGVGTEYHPYIVATKEHLNNVRNYPEAHFIMAKDIEFTDFDFSVSGAFYNEGEGWQPIYNESGNYSTAFTGYFNGNGHTIKNLQSSVGGLFGSLSNATVKNLGLIDGELAYSSIAGSASNSTIECCYNTCSVIAPETGDDAGGLVYGISGTTRIYNCYNTGSVTAADAAGGIIANGGDTAIVEKCYNEGVVTAVNRAGGISATGGIIIACANYGNVSASSTEDIEIGGISGSGATISYSYNEGSVTCHINNSRVPSYINHGMGSFDTTGCRWNSIGSAGGISGYGGNIENSYNAGTVECNVTTTGGGNRACSFAGGIVGSYLPSKTISNCYNAGNITANANNTATTGGFAVFSAHTYCGGLYGATGFLFDYNSTAFSGHNVTTENCYNIGTTVACSSSALGEEYEYEYDGGIVGLTTSSATFDNVYFDSSIDNEVGSGSYSGSITSSTASQMQNESTYSGFDFVDLWTMAGIANYAYPEIQYIAYEFDKNSIGVCDSIEIDIEDYLFFYYSQDYIEPGDTVQVGADYGEGEYGGMYYDGDVRWEVSNPNVLEVVETTNNVTTIIVKAINVGECKLTLFLDGVACRTETIFVNITDDTMINEYMDYLLDCSTLTTLKAARDSGWEIVNNFSEGDKAKIAFITCLKNDLGLGIITQEIEAALGMTTGMAESAVDEVIDALMVEVFSADTSFGDKVGNFKSKYKNFTTTTKALQFGQEDAVIEALASYTSFDGESLKKVLDIYKDYTSNTIDALELASATALTAQYERDVVVALMNSVATAPNGTGTDLYKGLERLLNEIDNIDTYAKEKFANNFVIDQLNGLLQKGLFKVVGADKGTFGLVSSMGKLIAQTHKNEGGIFADDYMKACIGLGFAGTMYNSLVNSYDTASLETSFNYYVAAVKVGLTAAIDIAGDDHYSTLLKNTAQGYLDQISTTCTYDVYIRQCRNEMKNAMEVKSLNSVVDDKIVSQAYWILPEEAQTASISTYSIDEYDFFDWNFEEEQLLNIPTIIDGSVITGIADYGFSGVSSVYGVRIPDSVESIGQYSFSNCSNLYFVTLGSGLEHIGAGAFYNCSNMQTINMPNCVKTIGENSFYGCSKLEMISLPETIEVISCNAFNGCASLKSIVIKNENATIDKNAFANCAEGLTIYGHSGGKVETYAQENNIQFVALEKLVASLSIETPASSTTYFVGDAIITEGLSLNVTYADGTNEVVSNGWIVTGNTSREGLNEVKVYYGDKVVTYDIQVEKNDSKDIDILTSKSEMFFGESMQLDVDADYVVPLSWETSNSGVITVENGYITACGLGKATISVSSNGIIQDSITLNVVNTKQIVPSETMEDYITFTAPKTGKYVFFSENSTHEIYGSVYDLYGVKLFGNSGINFRVECILEAGESYSLYTQCGNETNPINVSIDFVGVPESIIISDSNGYETEYIYGNEGDSKYLYSQFLPRNSKIDEVTWYSEDSDIASVDEKGYVCLNAKGKTYIHASCSSGITDSVLVIVNESYTNLGEQIKLNEEYMLYSSISKTSSFVPDVTGFYKVNVKQSDTDEYPDIYDNVTISVAPDAYHSGYGSGYSVDGNYIYEYNTVYYFESGKEYSVTVTSNGVLPTKLMLSKVPEPTSVSLSATTLSFTEGDYGQTLYVTLSPEYTFSHYTWESSDESVATVDEHGFVKPVGEGEATITLSVNGTSLTANCTVSVEGVEKTEIKIEEDYTDLPVGVYFVQPSVSGYYSIIFNDCYMDLNDNRYNSIGWINPSYNMACKYLEAGQTYIFEVTSIYNSGAYGSIQPCDAPTGISLDKEIKLTPNSLKTIYVTTQNEGSYFDHASATFTLADPDIAEITTSYSRGNITQWNQFYESYFTIEGLKIGQTMLTITTKDGGVYTFPVVIEDYPSIYDGSRFELSLAADENAIYRFVPEESASFTLEASGTQGCSIYVRDENNNYLTGVGENYWGEGHYVSVAYEFEEGKTYYVEIEGDYLYDGDFVFQLNKTVDASELVISETDLSGYVGESYTLSYELFPKHSFDEVISWESSDESVATVDENGVVVFVSEGTTTITATSENGLVATCVVEVKNIPSITCDEDKILNTNSDSGTGLFSFVPEVDGMYVFYSYDNDFDTYGYILDENMNTLDSDDDNGEGNNFKVVYSLVAGTQYYLKAKPLSSGSIGEYRVKVVKLVPATSVNIIPDVDINIFEGYEYRVDAELDPENSIDEALTWTSSNTSVATIDNDGNITALAAGTSTITVTTENGLTDSITVAVHAPEEIELNETKDTTITSEIDRNVFSFTPSEDGQYIIKISGDYYTQTSVQDSEMNWINSNSGYYYSFKVSLSADENYRIATVLWDEAESGEYSITIEKLVPATSLEITQEGTDGGYVGDYGYLYTNFGPENAIEEEITWVSSNPEVATIVPMYNGGVIDSSYIRINFVSAGTTTITATSANGLTDTIVITVTERPSLTSIEIGNGDSLTGYVGIAKYLWVNFYPDGAAHEQLTWSSDNEVVATVNEEGKVDLLTTGTVNITVVSESGLSDTCTITVGEVSTLTIGQPVNLTIVDNEEQYVKFVPTESGLFRIYVSDFSNSNRARITLRDSSMNWLFSEDDEEFIDYEFVAGQTYYIETNYCSWSGSGNGTYNLNAIKPVPATSISFDIGSEYNGYVGTSRYVNVIYAPDHAITESITWSSTDSSIVSVNRYGEITLNAVGTATITATSENGLVYSCVITVEDFETIEAGQEKNVILDGEEAYYYFTPNEDGYYSFYSYDNDHDTYGYILNSDMEIITSDDDGGDGNNFKVKYQLEAGVTYVLKARFFNTENSGSFKVCVEQTKYVTALEIVSLPEKTEYVEGFVNADNINYYGLKLKVTWSDGSTTDWKYNYDWSVDDEYIYRDASNVDETGNVELTCGEATVTLTLTIIENPVDHIEIVSGTKNSYVENYNGYIDENQDGEFFYYYNSYPSDAVIKIVYKNGTSETARVGDTVNDYSISWEHNQYNEPWVVGTNNKSIVTYLGHTVILPITVKENTVTGIEVVSGKVTCIENAYGYDTGNGYYYYYGMPSDVTLRITYSDGTSKVVSIHDVVDGYNFNWEADQYETPWTLGDDNYVTVTYLGQETQLPVSVISSPVDKIVINAAPSREYIYGDREYGNLYSDGEYEFYPTDLTGLSFTVYYVDGTSKTFTADDIDEYGEINGYGYELYYDEYNAQIGDFPVQFMYMGKTADYVVKLKESTVSSIAVTKQPNKTEFGNYYSPDFLGMELTITYTDGSTKVVTLTEDNLVYKYNPWWGELTYTVDVDGSSLTLEPYYGEDDVYFVAYYLGASCDIMGITYTEEKEIDTIELDKVSWNGDGMTVKITYTDESTETLTLDLVDFFDFEDSSGSGYGMTDKGLLYYYIETDYDNNGRPEEYRVSIFNRQITVEADAVIIGDVNGDGAVDNLDRLAITRYLADWDGYTEADINMAAADVNNDGSVDNLDRLALTRHLANWEGYEELPIN